MRNSIIKSLGIIIMKPLDRIIEKYYLCSVQKIRRIESSWEKLCIERTLDEMLKLTLPAIEVKET